ncbi:MAG: class I SAM-dependent methyltransferase [Anaerolineales bacterium]|nr:class I SAM-dependent methyltransferase [Anaerolineales bacterium]
MKPVVLRSNAVPVYRFLSYLMSAEVQGHGEKQRKILDCGAGGPVPPLALFHQHGFEIWGIDVSTCQLEMAEAFCREQNHDAHLHQGDMRKTPFEDETFDAVYEHYSMCHLSKVDTALAVSEMGRVLKPGGSCFLGFISTDTFPATMLGKERLPGEYWDEEDGEEAVLHSVFSDREAESLVSEWQVESSEKHVRYLRARAQELSLETWMDLYEKNGEGRSLEDWKVQYLNRIHMLRYSHLYYILKKF